MFVQSCEQIFSLWPAGNGVMTAAGPCKSRCFSILCSSLKCNFRIHNFLILTVMVVFMILLFIFYYCPGLTCLVRETSYNNMNHWLTKVELSVDQYAKVVSGFDSERDVLVFLHIQKTGGSTFGRHIARDTQGFPAPCRCQLLRKRCDCRDRRGWFWLFSRESAGWVCGLHSDWTELHECVPQVLNRLEGNNRRRRSEFHLNWLLLLLMLILS